MTRHHFARREISFGLVHFRDSLSPSASALGVYNEEVGEIESEEVGQRDVVPLPNYLPCLGIFAEI